MVIYGVALRNGNGLFGLRTYFLSLVAGTTNSKQHLPEHVQAEDRSVLKVHLDMFIVVHRPISTAAKEINRPLNTCTIIISLVLLVEIHSET